MSDDPGQPSSRRRYERWLPVATGLVALLSDLGAAIPGRTYFFRDFSVAFYPLRLFVARELRDGRLPFWNPYVYEGTFALPTLYPPDLLAAAWPGPAAVTWLLTLHLPLAALGAYFLARDLGADPLGALVSGSVFGLGGFALSSLNLYVFLQALALAPFVVLTLRRAGQRGGLWIAWAALVVAASLSTLAVEFVAQAVALGFVLGVVGRIRARLPRVLMAIALGVGLAAVPIAVTLGLLGETVRGAGFDRQVALGNEVHPLTLLQAVVPSLLGSLSDPVTSWWGFAFFSKGMPYFLSLYVGALAFALAALGVPRLARLERTVLIGAAVLCLWYSLGARGGLALAVSYLPGAGSFRFPSKALLMPHLVVAVLAGCGAARLGSGSGFRTLARTCGGLGAGLAAVASVPWITGPALARWARIEEPYWPAIRVAITASVGVEVMLLSFAAIVAWRAARGKTGQKQAAVLIALVLVVALARAGSGMNPQVSPQFFAPLPELAAQRLDALDGGRVFSYGLDQSPAFRSGLAARGPAMSLASFYLSRQILSGYSSILDRVETTEATDLTSFVPRPRELEPDDYRPEAVGSLIPWLRNAAVSRVLSLDPLAHPDLRLLTEVVVAKGGAPIRLYALGNPAPRAYLACRILAASDRDSASRAPYGPGFDLSRDVALELPAVEPSCSEGRVVRGPMAPGRESYDVQSDGPGYLVMRDSFARGFGARVDGRDEPVLRANGKHRAVFVPGGRHEVVVRYGPPGLRAGLWASALSLLGVGLVLWLRPLREEGRG